MAGNIQADNSGNILVEFDYNNIIVVDPNKTIDAFGKIQERLVDHEKLVMYANLEAEVLPRTKLAVGGSPEDRARTISVAKINFLKPNKETYLGSGYYDELTGENSTNYKGQNQMLDRTVVPPDGSKPYNISQPANLKDVVDNGLLGITQINITTNSSFVPSVKIELEDVQGKALFQLGNNSPYSAFFNLPYPQFYLTLKGYYGQAVRYQLNLEKFNARFNSFSGNYQVSLEFRGYKFNILNEIAMGHLLALPHMYGTRFDISTSPVQAQQNQPTALSTGGNNIVQNQGLATSNSQGVTQIIAKKGYQKIVEVYSEYKSKGLIPEDFPELTLVQLMNKLQNFEKNIEQSFPKVEVEPLTNIRTYKLDLKQYFDTIRGGSASWFARFMNPAPLILKNGNRVYVFKSELDLETKDAATSELKKDVENSNKALAGNATLGVKGPSPIPNKIKYDTIAIPSPSNDEIDWVETTRQQTGVILPTDTQIGAIQNKYKSLFIPIVKQTPEKQLVEERPKFFIFEGFNRFDKLISEIEAQANKKLSEYEASISDKLLKKLSDRATGIGFKPTVRNIVAVVMASAEGFIRLLDEVHTNAWNVKYDPVRKNAILMNPSSAPGSDTVDYLKLSEQAFNQESGLKFSEIPVYPWPQFFVETPEDKKGRFQLKYIADPTVVDITQGYLYDKWPEVEFVEEYMVGITQKFDPPAEPPPLDNERDTNRLNINAIEYPNLGIAYTNKEEVKFFYEIWERQLVTSRYSNLLRANSNQLNDLMKLNLETEVNNIVNGLGLSSPYLTYKLKNFDLNSSNYEAFLKNISNAGTGRAYQDFIRDFFVTPYLRNLTDNSFGLLNANDLGKVPQTSAKSDALLALITNATNNPQIIDTYPFTNQTWVSNNMAFGSSMVGTAVYNTNKTLKVFEPRKIIANFSDTYNFTENRPVTNFSYLTCENPTTQINALNQDNSVPVSLEPFYLNRKIKDFVPTEGYCFYKSPKENYTTQTTTSILNTPYFVNSILNGVDNNRSNDPYPYVQAAYLFLNSLPLATLKEKYKKVNGLATEDLDYIASCLKKFGAIHKLPYAWILKLGSNWHRYKKFKESGVDILASAWKNFQYLQNYSPVLSSLTQTYKFTYNKQPISITLQNEQSNIISMDVGFYPKVINDFNYFYTGYDLYVDYTDQEIQSSVNLGMKVFNFSKSNIQGALQGDKTYTMKTWSVVVPKLQSVNPDNCSPNNTKGLEYFIVPSFGTQLNQTKEVCFSGPTQSSIVNVTSNPNVYNGTVRSIWSAPNYGYFDGDQIVYPKYDSYMNFIDTANSEQGPVSLLNIDGYSKIEEIFSVFDKRILDSFEDEFLKFSRPVTNNDGGEEPAQFLQSTVNLNANFRNFQGLFTTLMTVPSDISSTTNDENYFTNLIGSQFGTFKNAIQAFMEYDVIFKYGNPSNYKRRIFDSYLSYQATDVVVDPIPFEPYVQNSLPSTNGGVTLNQSQINNPQAWLALELEVGFSTIPNLQYTSVGSYITDFFIQNNIAFTQQNVVLLAPLIKMWTTQKLVNPSITPVQFKNSLQEYLNNATSLQNDFLNQVLSGVRAKLPDQQQLPQGAIKSAIQGEQSKVENYEIFKALNDKWIAGGDYTNKTLFEDMLFLDRASRNIGETIIIDIFELKSLFGVSDKEGEFSLNQAMSVFTFISGMLIKNNFTVMNLPSYVNFYNVQDVDGTTIPQPEGSLEFANSMWGTFLDVDYRNSGPKMVCFYVGKPSSYLDLPKGNFRFRDDAFELRRASENPLIENQKDKKDWAISNKCVGFNVDIGTRNQNIFYSFSVSQDAGVATSEAINTQINMVNQATGRNSATQNVSLYNLYKNRSYKCNVVALGNALIQPTMYFNLRHVPMFYGPYLITEVQHTIQPGNFQTSFTGVRQSVYDLPAIDNFLQSINQNLLTKLQELLKIEKEKPTVSGTTENDKAAQVVQKSDTKKDASNSCVANVDTSVYTDFTVTTANETTLTPQAFAKALQDALPGQETLQTIIFAISYVKSYVVNGNSGSFVGFNNNFGNISLYNNFSPTYKDYFQKTYCCVSVKATSAVTKAEPLVSFENVTKYIQFMEARLKANVDRIIQLGIAKYYVCYWPKSNVSESYYDANEKQFETLKTTLFKGTDLAVQTKLIPKTVSEQVKKQVEQKPPATSPRLGVTPTPTPVPPLPGQVCPPPVVNSFAPLTGNTGTIIQINGTNFEDVTGVKIINTFVDKSKFTLFNKTTIRVPVPQVQTGTVKVSGPVVLTSPYGDSVATTLSVFTYDPAVSASATSSPGSYQNNANAAVSQPQTNTNPQNTGAPLMVPSYTKIGSTKVTSTLEVKMDPTSSAGNIQPNVTMVVSVFDVYVENNTLKKKLAYTTSSTQTNLVTNNIFKVTYSQVENLLITQPITPFNTTPIKPTQSVELQFTLTSKAVDSVKYPQPTEQSFNFTFRE